jgi:hypothetical protein
MRKISNIFFTLVLVLLTVSTQAQELNCSVTINSSQLSGSDKSVFDALEKAVFEFMNNRTWTNNVYSSTERIECSILINITELVSAGEYKGTIQIQSRRPVYNTSYFSTIFNHLDKDFEFKFNEFDPLEYSENTFISNLTSVLAFYANIIIALDYDSFSLKGGTPYLLEGQKIISNAQAARESGWKAFEGDRNRYWIVENLLHKNYIPLRECMYRYHRLGFDVMSENVEKGRAEVLNSINLLEKVYKISPGSFILQIFFNAKSDELVNLFSDALSKEKAESSNLLNKINPANSNKYQKILKGK